MITTESTFIPQAHNDNKRSSGSILKHSFDFNPAGILLENDAQLNPRIIIVATNSTHPSDDDKQIKAENNKRTSKSIKTITSNIGYLSELSKAFTLLINNIISSRSIFSTDEYPNSFTGEEAIDTFMELLGNDWSRKNCKSLARSIMKSTPPLFLPIVYSTKSLKSNTFYDSPSEVYTLNDGAELETNQFSQGLIPSLLECYTPLCSKFDINGCYSLSCPNRRSIASRLIVNKELHRNISLISSQVSSQDTLVSRSWASAVPREIFQSTPTKEMKRQEAIYELIYTEEDYVRDLMLLDEFFAKPLSVAQCIESKRRESFCKDIFGNYETILKIHQVMYRELRDYQLTSQDIGINGGNIGFVDKIGPILLKYVDKFMDVYTEYAPHFITAEYTTKRETETNMVYHNFIREKEKQAETRKLPFRHYIILPITRLQRYPLLLDAILKRTTDEQEQKDLKYCIEHIRQVAFKMDKLTNDMKQRVHIRQINDKIIFDNQKKFDLDLLKPGRQLVYEGFLKRRAHLGVEYVELYVFLFDHLLLMTKPRRNAANKIVSYSISKRPIPLSLLVVNDIIEGSLFNSLRSSKLLGDNVDYFNNRNSSATQITLVSDEKTEKCASIVDERIPVTPYQANQHSLMIRHLGRNGGEYTLLTDTPSSRLVWKEQILSTQNEFFRKEKENNVFQISAVSDTLFGSLNTNEKITCTTSFTGSLGDKMIIVGTAQGIWIGKEGCMYTLKKVLTISDVTQVDVLQSNNILLVLADKILTAYPIMQLDPTNSTNLIPKTKTDKPTFASRQVANRVTYFNTGTCHEKTLIIVMKRKGRDSHFKAFQPVCGDLNDSKNSKYISSKASFMNKHHSWFKLYKEFYIGSDSKCVHFLKSKLLIENRYGFEVIDPERLNDVQFNLPDIRTSDFRIIQTSEALPLNIFRYNENFLICYDQFAFLITSHGELVKKNYDRIEWEGSPQSVAFCYPYVFGFDANFVEIRNVETGKLVQVIVNDSIRYLAPAFKNTNTTESVVYATMSHQYKPNCQNIVKLEPLYTQNE